MNRIPTIDPTTATGPTAELFAAMKLRFGVVPNLARTFAQSPATLGAYLAFGPALDQGVLSARVREQLSLVVAQANGCDYCLSAHTLMGKGAGLTPEAIEAARRGNATDPKADALLKFAQAVIATRGKVSDATLATTRAAGATDAELIETVASVALNILTNYTNNVAQTIIDFPLAKPLTHVAT